MWRRASVAALALLVASCATTPLETYQESHPGWKPHFPRAGIDAQETLASIYAPHDIERGAITEVQRLRVFETSPDFRKLAIDDVASGKAPSDLAIVAHVHCATPTSLWWFYNDALSWYALRGGRLVAWHHVRFQKGCAGAIDRLDDVSPDSLEGVERALLTITDPATAADLAARQEAPAASQDPAELACPGTNAFAKELAEAILRERGFFGSFTFHDLVATVEVRADRSFEVVQIRPSEGALARLIVQHVRKVSASQDRPEPPDCLVGGRVDVALPNLRD